MQPHEIAVDALAVARITRLVVDDEITRELREAAHEKAPEKLAYLIDCPYCVSVWAGLAVAAGLVPKPVRYALALSEVTTTMRTLLNALPKRWN